MTFASFLVILCCFIGASVSSQAFTATFKVISGQWSKGYFEGTIYYDWNQNNFNLQFPLIGLYNELYRFNTPRGYSPGLANGQFFAQYLYRNSLSCSCETSSLNYVMPPFYQGKITYDGKSVDAWDQSSVTKVTINGKTCNQYVPNSAFSKNSLVTQYSETDTGDVCGFALQDGRIFTLTNLVNKAPASTVFTPPTGCKCSKPIDIVLSLDRSGSIQYQSFIVEKAFAKNITGAFDFGPQKTNMAVLNWNFNRWTQIGLTVGSDANNVQAAIDAMACSSANPKPTDSCTCCGTPIGGALWDAGREMTTSTRKATKIIILLTDGCQNHIFNETLNTAIQCSCSSEIQCATVGACKDDIVYHFNQVTSWVPGIKVLVIGVGTNATICPNQLQLTAGNIAENVWNPQSWDQLSAFVETIAATACSASNNPCTDNCCGICSCGSCLKPLNCSAPDDCTEAYLDPATGCCATRPIICPTQNCQDVVCNPVGGCTYTERVCTPPNTCVDSKCDPVSNNCKNTKNSNPACTVIPPECTKNADCVDSRKCYDHTCFNQTCVHTAKTCNSDACTKRVCDPSFGNCSATLTNCDDGSACTTDSCDTVKGCSNVLIKCPVSDDKCNIPLCNNLTGCYFDRINCSAYVNTNCTIWSCKNGTCSNVTICVIVPPNAGVEIPITAVVGGAVGAAVIAGIVIAVIIAVAAAAGGGAYAFGAGGGAGAAPAIGNNPLYVGTPANTNNPLFKAV